MMRSSSKKARIDPDDLGPEGGYKVKTYWPTLSEMKDFSAYIKKIHDDGGHRAGLAKIVPPPDYVPRKAGYGDDKLYDMDITSPIRQRVTGESGLYQQFNVVEKKKISVRNFKKLAEEKYSTPLHRTQEELERIFWKNIFTQPSIYGADVSGSLYDDDIEEFNLTRLNTILDNIGDDYGVTIQGVNTAYLYFGMWKSSFSWHTEDMDLYSINYLHDGQPKSWYCIAPEHGKRFERLAASFFPHSFRTCKAFLRHKTTLISPQVLKKYSIPFSRCTQSKGEFMITFPFSYHSGYNHGFNIAEATNFAIEYWIDFGKWATRCECSTESVKISMQTFVKRYQSDRYENWLQGKDICKDPRDPKHVAAAPKPTEYDLYLMGTHTRNENDEEENIENNTLQQNQSSNVKIMTNNEDANNYSTLTETFQRYSDFLSQADNNKPYEKSMQLTHYSPIPTKMQEIDHLADDNNQETDVMPFNFVPRNSTPYIGHNVSEKDNKSITLKKPDYQKELAKMEAKKRKKEEKARKRREKKMKGQMLKPKELLQFLPSTFTLEKRFNRCLAALAPHCSICQILVPFPKDDEAIWGKSNANNCPPNETKIQESIKTSPNQNSNNTNPVQPNERPDSISPELSLANNTTVQNHSPSVAGPKVEEFKLPDSSAVLLPRGVFNSYFNRTTTTSDENASTTDQVEGSDTITEENELIPEEKLEFLNINLESSELLQCSVCMLCVHKLCYGLDKMPENKADWICDRCVMRNRSVINCELCPCRGGALKELKGIWMHITCALTLPDIGYTDLIMPDKNPNKKLPKPPQEVSDKLNCFYCAEDTSLSRYVQGKCIPCSGFIYVSENVPRQQCPTSFHPTCAHRHGAEFDYNDRDPGSKFFTLCEPCKINYETLLDDPDQKQKEPKLDPIPVGAQVVARASNNVYYEGIVNSNEFVTYYSIYYPHLSTTEHSITSDKIINFDPNKKFRIGDKVFVRGRKNNVKEGKFKSQERAEEYLIQFNSEKINRVEIEKVSRKNIYLNVDQMPEELIMRYKGSIANNAELPGIEKAPDFDDDEDEDDEQFESQSTTVTAEMENGDFPSAITSKEDEALTTKNANLKEEEIDQQEPPEGELLEQVGGQDDDNDNDDDDDESGIRMETETEIENVNENETQSENNTTTHIRIENS